MQLSKHIITVMISILALGAGYLIIGQTHISTSDGVKITTESISTVSQSDTGVETDTSKRLEIVANSGTQWGISPFGSGKPLTEEKKPEFKKPNTEWKTRTLSGITYVFGEGNPKEVALDKHQLQAIRQKCGTQSDPDNIGYLCKEGDGYVTPEVEKYLNLALSDNNFDHFSQCFPTNISYITAPNFLDIDTLLFIDSNTGRKEIDIAKLMRILEDLKYYINPPESYAENQEVDACMAKYGNRIYQNLYEVYRRYISI
jgi:hypothetical protein